MKKTKKKRKRHYHTGEYVSIKSGQICKFRSGWEKSYMEFLDMSLDVISWEYESIVIPYVANKKTGKLRKYYPDFFVTKENDKFLIEIKPSRRIHQAKVMKKISAANDWCNVNNVKLLIVTEYELKVLGLLK
jgi:hypothetical protein